MPFFKRVHITAKQQIENERIVADTQEDLIKDAIACGHACETTFGFNGWWKEADGFTGFKTVRGAKSSHTKLVKRENELNPAALFISLTWEDVNGSGRCRESWFQI